ncbi:HBL/NHE enterotoxin family protein [Streptomyces sp. KLMMK]|uniref:HBL/NHE enterotoxin family protein n=1 Tax=Streptomyces sp. KLMMK TaxID=3109353 RepID=UPI002FFF6F08
MLHLLADADEPAFDTNGAISQHAMDTAGARTAVETYVTMILEQPTVKLDKIENLEQFQTTAKSHGQTWRDSLAPKLIQTNTDLLGFANDFDSYYDPLVDMAKDINTGSNKQDFIDGLSDLVSSIESLRDNAQAARDALSPFYTDVETDHGNFQKIIDKAHSVYEGEQGEIDAIRANIDALSKRMSRDLTLAAAGSVGVVLGALTIAVGALAEIPTGGGSTGIIIAGAALALGGAGATIAGSVDYDSAKRDMAAAITQLADLETELAVLHGLGTQFTGLRDACKLAADALGTMLTTWNQLLTRFKTVIEYMKRTETFTDKDKVNSRILQIKLNTAKKDWNDVHTKAVEIDQQMTTFTYQVDLTKAA